MKYRLFAILLCVFVLVLPHPVFATAVLSGKIINVTGASNDFSTIATEIGNASVFSWNSDTRTSQLGNSADFFLLNINSSSELTENNATLTAYGNITNYGNLTFNRTKVMFASNDTNHLWFIAGGRIIIDNSSNITSLWGSLVGTLNNTTLFAGQYPTYLQLSNSYFSFLGYATGSWIEGIHVDVDGDCLIENNTIEKTYRGIILYASPNCIVRNNTIRQNSDIGMIVEAGSTNVTIENNNFTEMLYQSGTDKYDIWIHTSNNVTIRNNTVSNGNVVIYLRESNNCTIANNILYNITPSYSWGVFLWNASDNLFANNTIFNGTHYGIDLYGRSNRNTVINNTIYNVDYGIGLFKSTDAGDKPTNNTLINNTVYNNTNGIRLSNAINTTITANIFYNSTSKGIYITDGNATLTNNSIHNNRDGIYLYPTQNTTLTNNTVYNNSEYGIVLQSSANVIMANNTLTGNGYNFQLLSYANSNLSSYSIDTTNTADGGPIYYLSQQNNTIYDNSTNASLFVCVSCRNVTFNNLGLHNNGFGILLWRTNDSGIYNSTFSDSEKGIDLQYSLQNTIVNNTLRNASTAEYAIQLMYSSSNNILANNTVYNNYYGVFIWISSANNNLSNNTFYNNTRGITIWSGPSILTNNTVYNNSYGIYIQSAGNTVANNTAYNNSYGIYLYSASSNTVTGNTAYNNSYGIDVSYSSSSNTLTNNTLNNNLLCDFNSSVTSVNNIVTNLMLSTANISFKGKDFTINATTSPTDSNGIGKYFSATNTSTTSWLYINVSYNQSDLSRIDEGTLMLHRYNGTAWVPLSLTGVNTTENFVWANITSFSVFAPLGNFTKDVLVGSESSGGAGDACTENILAENQTAGNFSIEQYCGVKIIFSKNESYNLIAKEIIGSLVTFEISQNSKKILVSAPLGQPIYFDVNKDSVNDLKIFVILVSGSTIKLELAKLHSAKAGAQQISPQPEINEETPLPAKETPPAAMPMQKVKQNFPWLAIPFALLILLWLGGKRGKNKIL